MSPGALLVTNLVGQVTGSGCCGKLDGDSCDLGDEDPFAAARREHIRLVTVAQEQAAAAGLRLEIVDARNLVGLIVAYHRQVRAHGWPGLLPALRGYLGWFPVPCLIIEGRIRPLPAAGQEPRSHTA